MRKVVVQEKLLMPCSGSSISLTVAQPGDVHVWRAGLEADAATVERCRRLLSADERERAERFHFPHLRTAYTVGRGLLRIILGCYLNDDPAMLRFLYSPQGKPALDDRHGSRYRFNLAHSHGLAVYAITLDRAVGVDVERIRPEVASDAIAEQHFSPREQIALQQLPPELRTQAFFHAWTRKEAYLKGLGLGLSLPLEDFDVSLTPGEPAALLAVRGAARAGPWSLETLTVPAGYVGAVAIEGEKCGVCCRDWNSGWSA